MQPSALELQGYTASCSGLWLRDWKKISTNLEKISDSFGPATGMSGYGNKNPPWGRNPGGMGGMGPPHLGMFEQNVGGGGMLQQGIPLQQQGMGLAGMAPQGMAPVQGQVTGISYPAPRGVAPGGFLPNILQQQQAAMSVMGNVQTSQQVFRTLIYREIGYGLFKTVFVRVLDLVNPPNEHSVGLSLSCMITSALWMMTSSSKPLCAKVKFRGSTTGSSWRLHSTLICLSNGMQQGCK